MKYRSRRGAQTLAQLAEFDEIIDVRSPAEFAEDHIPGAINCPVLDDRQRAEVGTLYKQVGAFEARRLGGAMVAENLARHLFAQFQTRPRAWRPLVYCWRGGMRSGVFVQWLRLIGWDAQQFDGGYKHFRHEVIAATQEITATLPLRIVCGPTGSGKTRLLHALAAAGAQVLDLEGLAAHKGSVLGGLPGQPQPSQKWFETSLHLALQAFDPQHPVFVEAESRKIGRIEIPPALYARMCESPCVAIEATRAARLTYLLQDFAYLDDDRAGLAARLDSLHGLHSNDTLARWHVWAMQGELEALFAELIDLHYDPLYKRSHNASFRLFPQAQRFSAEDLQPPGLTHLASAILGAMPEL